MSFCGCELATNECFFPSLAYPSHPLFSYPFPDKNTPQGNTFTAYAKSPKNASSGYEQHSLSTKEHVKNE